MIDTILSWAQSHQAGLAWLAGLSLLASVGSLVALPFLVSLIPEDYFSGSARHEARLNQLHPLLYLAVRVTKNLLGWLFVLAGIAMLILPGQGLLTLLMGIVLSDFPGKYSLERRIASNQKILSAINWMRLHRGKRPLLAPSAMKR